MLKRLLARLQGRRARPPVPTEPDGKHARLTFFGGKGGVGKTTCAGAWALAAARRGERVLLISTDPAHSIGDLLEQELDASPRKVTEGLEALELDPETAARNYIAEVKANLRRIAAPELMAEAERQVDLAALTPGAEEAALFDALVGLILANETRYDHLIFDTAPTGHTLHLLTLPEVMGAWIEGMLTRRERAQALWEAFREQGGEPAEDVGGSNAPDPAREALMLRRDRFARVRRLLLDPARTRFYFVLNPDRLSVVETERAVRRLTEHQVPVAGLIVNRVLGESADGNFNARRREQERAYLAEIQRQFSRLPRQMVALQEHDVRGLAGLDAIARVLEAGTLSD